MAFSPARKTRRTYASREDVSQHRRLDATKPEELELLQELAEEFHPGMRVKAIHFEDYEGVVRFIGNTLLGPGPWIGIELDEAVGRSNGSISGVFYFDCPESHGAFVPPDCVEPLQKVVELDGGHGWEGGEVRARKTAGGGVSGLLPTASSPLMKYQQMNDSGYSEDGSVPYFPCLPPQLRSRRGAVGSSMGSTISEDSVMGASGMRSRRRRKKRGGASAGAGGGRIRRSVVPYYEAFAPVRKEPEVGQRVRVKGHLGVIKFLGGTLFEFGTWVGVEFDKPVGRNAGDVNGTFYFKCKPGHGIFVRPSKVEWIPWEFAPLPAKKKKHRKEKHGVEMFLEDSDSPAATTSSESESESDTGSDASSSSFGSSSDDGRRADKKSKKKKKKKKKKKGSKKEDASPAEPPAEAHIRILNGVVVNTDSLAPEHAEALASGEAGAALDDDPDASGAAADEHCVEFKFGCSNMKFYHLDNKLQGMFYGHLVGSAIGLLCEDLTFNEITEAYGGASLDGMSYATRKTDNHRLKWYETGEVQGVWGVDANQMLAMLQALVDRKGHVSEEQFAETLKEWVENGFEDIGQTNGVGASDVLTQICETEGFVSHPHLVAKNAYFKTGKVFANNEAVARSPIMGLCDFWDLDRVAANAQNLCLVTHTDPRCVASCVAVAVAIACLLQKQKRSYTRKGLMFVLNKAFKYAKRCGVPDEAALEAAIKTADLDTLNLGDPKTARHTYKCLGAAFFALRTATDFATTICDIAAEGGDADANCALAGALIGVKLGHWSLPLDWPPKELDFRQRTWPPGPFHFSPDEEDPLIMPRDWLDLRDAEWATDLYNKYLQLLRITIDTYSTKREY